MIEATQKDDLFDLVMTNFIKLIEKNFDRALVTFGLESEEDVINYSKMIFYNSNKEIAIKSLKKLFSEKEKKNKLLADRFNFIIHTDKDLALNFLNTLEPEDQKNKLFAKHSKSIFKADIFFALTFLNTLESEDQKNKLISRHFRAIFIANKDLVLPFLETLEPEEHRRKFVSKHFMSLLQDEKDLALTLLNILRSEEQKNILFKKHFYAIFKIDKDLAINFLNNLQPKEQKSELILRYFKAIFDVNKDLAINFLNTLQSEEQKSRLFVKYFKLIFKADKNFALKHFNALQSEEQKSRFFTSILNKDIRKAFIFLNILQSEEQKSELFVKHFKLIFKADKDFALRHFNALQSEEQKSELFVKHFKLIFKADKDFALRHFNALQSEEQKSELFEDNFILFFKEISIFASYEKEIKSIIHHLSNAMYTLQNKYNLSLQSHVLAEATVIKFFDTNKLPENIQISQLLKILSKIEKPLMFKLIVSMLKNRLENIKGKGKYSEQIYKVIIDNKLKLEVIYQLIDYIDNNYFRQQVLNYMESEKAKGDVKKILNKIINEKNRVNAFMEVFREKYPKKILYTVIPKIAEQDYRFAMELLKKIANFKYEQIALEETFLALYDKNLSQAITCYEKINYYPKKRDLSRTAIDNMFPFIENSFIGQFKNILNDQNILNTPFEISEKYPDEIFKYYAEDKDKKTKLEDIIETLQQLINSLKQAKSNQDIDLHKKTLLEVEKIKESIKQNDELYASFLEEYNIDEFTFETTNILDILIGKIGTEMITYNFTN